MMRRSASCILAAPGHLGAEPDVVDDKPRVRSEHSADLQAERLQAALAADVFRFDASDLMPTSIGSDLFWDAMMSYAEDWPDSLGGILNELDAAWPDGP